MLMILTLLFPLLVLSSSSLDERLLSGGPSATDYECKIWTTVGDYYIESTIWSSCPCYSGWSARSEFLHCVESVINSLRASGALGGVYGKKYWYDRFKYINYPDNRCGPIFTEGDPRRGTFYNYGPNDSPPTSGRIDSSSSEHIVLFNTYGYNRALTEEREITADANQLPSSAPICRLWFSYNSDELLAYMDSRCLCDGSWESRSSYLHECVENVIDNEWYGRMMWGDLVLPFWYNEFKFNHYLNNQCGYLFSSYDYRYGVASSAVRL